MLCYYDARHEARPRCENFVFIVLGMSDVLEVDGRVQSYGRATTLPQFGFYLHATKVLAR
jgi:hypothetical protein